MTKKALAISLGILACIFLMVLPTAAEEPSGVASPFFEDLYQAFFDWIAPPDAAEVLATPPQQSTPEAISPDSLDEPEIGGHIPPGG